MPGICQRSTYRVRSRQSERPEKLAAVRFRSVCLCRDQHLSNAIDLEVELLGGGLGHVNNAAMNKRSAVIDIDRDLMAVVEVFDVDLAADGEGAMSGIMVTL